MKAEHFALCLAAVALASCAKKGEGQWPARDTSILAILANPEAFHEKKVVVFGVYRRGFEMSSLSPDRELGATAANCLWVDLSGYEVEWNASAGEQQRGEWARIVATVDAHSHGHTDRYPAALTRIESISFSGSWLERLDEKRANKAPEPTPGSVTPRATEGVSK